MSAAFSAIILDIFADLLTTFRILSILVLIAIVASRIDLKHSPQNEIKNSILKGTILFNLSLFIILLITGTGGFFSPLFVVIYIATLGLSFILTFPAAIVFLFSGLVVIAVSSFFKYNANPIPFDLSFLIIQLISLFGVIPFSYVVASKYRLKGKVADYLFEELSFSKTKEDLILGNIDEGVITLDRNFSVSKMNKIAESLSGFKNEQVVGQDFFKIFKFQDRNKNTITKDQFPIKEDRKSVV